MISTARWYVFQAILSVLYWVGMTRAGRRIKSLPLMVELAVWFIISFALTFEMVDRLPWLCKEIRC